MRNGVLIRDGNGRMALKDGSRIPREFNETIVDALKRAQIPLQSHYVALDSEEEYFSEDYYDYLDNEDEFYEAYPVHTPFSYPAQKPERKIASTRRDAFEKIATPKPYSSSNPSRTPTSASPKPTTTFRPANLPAIKPIDARLPRIHPTTDEDVDMRDQTPNKNAPPGSSATNTSTLDKPRQKAVPRQSELSTQVDMHKVVKSILNTEVLLSLGDILGTSKELSDEVSDQLRRKNPKPPAETNSNRLNNGSKPNLVPNGVNPNTSKPRPTSAPGLRSHHIESQGTTLSSSVTSPREEPALVHYQNGNRPTAGTLIYTQWSCDGSPTAVESIIDTGSQLNIINASLVPEFICSPIDPAMRQNIIDASSGAKELKGLIRGVSLRNGDIETVADLYVGEGVPFQLLLGRPWQVNNRVSIDQRDSGAYLVFPTQGRSGRKLELPTATQSALSDTSILTAITPVSCLEEPLDDSGEGFDSEFDLDDAEDGLEDSDLLDDYYSLNVRTSQDCTFATIFETDPMRRCINRADDHPSDSKTQADSVYLFLAAWHWISQTLTLLRNCFHICQNWGVPVANSMGKMTYCFVLGTVFGLASGTNSKYSLSHLFAIFLAIFGILLVYKQRGRAVKRIYQHYNHLHPTTTDILNSARSTHVDETPIILHTRSMDVTSNEELTSDAPLVAVDRLTSHLLTEIISSIPTWPPSPNGVYLTDTPTFRFEHNQPTPNTTDHLNHLRWANEASEQHDFTPWIRRMNTVVTSTNSVVILEAALGSTLMEYGVMLEATKIVQTNNDPERRSIIKGRMYYTFIRDPDNPLRPTHTPSHPSHSAAVTSHPRARPSLIRNPRYFVMESDDDDDDELHEPMDLGELSKDFPMLNMMESQTLTYGLANTGYPTSDRASVSTSVAAIYSPSLTSRRASFDSAMDTESTPPIDANQDPREPFFPTARAMPALETQLARLTNLSFGIHLPPVKPLTPIPTLTHAEPTFASNDSCVLQRADFGPGYANTLRCASLQTSQHLFRVRPTTEDRFDPPGTSNEVDKPAECERPSPAAQPRDYDPRDCQLEPSNGQYACIRHGLTHEQHFLLQESGFTLNEVDAMGPQERLETLRAIVGTTITLGPRPKRPRMAVGLGEGETSKCQPKQPRQIHSPSLDEAAGLTEWIDRLSLDNPPPPPTTDAPRVLAMILRPPPTAPSDDAPALSSSTENSSERESSDSSFEIITNENPSTPPPSYVTRPPTPYPSPTNEFFDRLQNTWQGVKFPKSLSGNGVELLHQILPTWKTLNGDPEHSGDDSSTSASPTTLTTRPRLYALTDDEMDSDSSVETNTALTSRYSPPLDLAHLAGVFSCPNDLAPGRFMYELITDLPDPWDYNDASTSIVQVMIAPFEITKRGATFSKEPPPDHPYWREDHSKFERVRTWTSYNGTPDNHPLTTWDNDILLPEDYDQGWFDDGDQDLAQIVVDVCEAMRRGTINPQDWDRVHAPTSIIDKTRRCVNDVWSSTQPNLESLRTCSTCIMNHTDEPLESVEGNPILRANTYLMSPMSYGNVSQCRWFTERYRNPWQDPNASVAVNPWNVKIVLLRRIRLELLQFFRETVEYLIHSPEFRYHVDGGEASTDARHFWYHHCPFFRLLENETPLIFQGFSRRCIHVDYGSAHNWEERRPNTPRNPLITAAEDEFLHHAANFFLEQDRQRFANTLRHLRELTPFHSSQARELFELGYLDPDYMFDGQGNRRAIAWRSTLDATL
ncbi:hypothetical protein EYR40_005674 [Pleurotus pulmonarius]|nr:hypothetical protein EYR40_005674 [Pleurotus pulmonarius]